MSFESTYCLDDVDGPVDGCPRKTLCSVQFLLCCVYAVTLRVSCVASIGFEYGDETRQKPSAKSNVSCTKKFNLVPSPESLLTLNAVASHGFFSRKKLRSVPLPWRQSCLWYDCDSKCLQHLILRKPGIVQG